MDETQPLLGHVVEETRTNDDKAAVDFEPNGDPENPMDWPTAYKWGIILLLAFMAFTVTFTCIGVVPVAHTIAGDLGGNGGNSASVLLVTIWELGEAAGPLLIAPLSEIYGRYPVYNGANILFIFGVLLAALSPSIGVFIFARFVTGLAVATNVLNPAIIGDIFPSHKRGSGMSLIMLAPLLGGAIGPAITGTIAQTLGWRAVLWISAGLAIFCEIVFFSLFRETYQVTILRRKAARLREETGNESLKCAWDGDDVEADRFWSTLSTAVKRPLLVAADSSVLQILSLYGGFVFSLYYIIATSLPEMLANVYHFSPQMVGFSFLIFSIGATGSVVICNIFLDKTYVWLTKLYGKDHPEYRLPLMIAGAIILPASVAFYGWVPTEHWHVGFLLLAVSLVGFVMMLVWVPLSSYVVDAFGLYSASSMTTLLIARCLGGTLLPIAVPPLTDAFGFGYGFTVIGAVCLVLAPLPAVVMRYGSKWRQNSAYSRNQ